MIRTYKSGQVVEKVKFWVPAQARPRSPKKAATSARKQEENDRSAIKHLARMINCNYSYGDLWLTLKYTPEGFEHIAGDDPDEVLKAAEHDLELFIRRLRRRFQKEGRELLIIAGTSDTDGDTGELVRPHHHVIMPREAFEICQQEWKFGSIDYQTLKDQKDYTPLAAYICRQGRRKAGECRWKASRNLKKPAVFEEVTQRKGELRPAPGAIVKEIGRYDEESGNHYIRYIPKKREKRGGHRQGAEAPEQEVAG